MLVSLIALLGIAACSACKQATERKSVQAMSEAELQAYFDALSSLNTGPRPTQWHRLMAHVDLSQKDYLAAHRAILFRVEKAIQEDHPAVTVPYWDCLPFRSDASKDPALSEEAFGYKTGCANGKLADFKTSSGSCIRRREMQNFCPNYPLVEQRSLQDKNPATYAANHLPLLQYLVQTFYTARNAPFAFQDPLMLSYMATMDRYWDAWLVHNNFTTSLYDGQDSYPTGPNLFNGLTARQVVEEGEASCVKYIDYVPPQSKPNAHRTRDEL